MTCTPPCNHLFVIVCFRPSVRVHTNETLASDTCSLSVHLPNSGPYGRFRCGWSAPMKWLKLSDRSCSWSILTSEFSKKSFAKQIILAGTQSSQRSRRKTRNLCKSSTATWTTCSQCRLPWSRRRYVISILSSSSATKNHSFFNSGQFLHRR